MAAMSAVEMIDTEGNYPAGMDIPIYGQRKVRECGCLTVSLPTCTIALFRFVWWALVARVRA